ncbi:MAG: SUMF1/EgtB/PvdO family nonheme iron enzyme, partial [Treponema sp.]|jgi:formylglycine-generating enzyme required for sulfatase activity|nr:SUMF1/EgtB/PvdO family nonheme iron enzyme [Treponema sp.]
VANTFTFTVKATNSVGNDEKQLTIIIESSGTGTGVAPKITTAGLPEGTLGTAYSHTLVATGSTPLTWSHEGTMPAGLSLGTTGTITGTPTTADTYTFTVKAENSVNNDTKQFTITIAAGDNNGNDGLTLDTAIPLTENVWKDGELTDTVPYMWYSFPVSSGTEYNVWWNGGYNGYGDGTKTGDIDARAVYEDDILASAFWWKNQGWTSASSFIANKNGTVYLSVRGSGDLSSKKGTFSIVYSKGSTRPGTGGGNGPTITPAKLPDGTVGTAYSQTLAATGAGAVTWEVIIGALPPDLSLGTTGDITGTPTAAGTFPFTVKAANSAGSDTSQFSITIAEGGNPTIPDIEMVPITGGSFTMGSPTTEKDREKDEIQHEVTLTGFSMGKYPVTQAQYRAVMMSNPSAHQVGGFRASSLGGITDTANFPVEQVSWFEALVFCNTLSMLEDLSPAYSISGSTDPADWGTPPKNNEDATWSAVIIVAGSTGYRLPTEAQWEYACRAGTVTAYNTGATISDSTGWYSDNSGDRTHSVGEKPANAYGLYDMHGNVWEWCWDWYGFYKSGAQNDPTGAVSGNYRVRRGGSWSNIGQVLRSAYRGIGNPYGRDDVIGFRLVRP